jgi:hypothetical protein
MASSGRARMGALATRAVRIGRAGGRSWLSVARSPVLGTLLAALALLPTGSRAQAGAPAGAARAATAVSLGVVVLPETVTVGEPFRVVVRLRAPRGATLEFPQAPDSGTGVEALDPVDVVPTADTLVSEQTATYRLAAWDVGTRAIRLPDLLVRENGAVRRVPVGGALSIFVASVLPADSSERVPKAARPLYEFGPPWWWWALVGLAALGVVGVLWWLWRRRRALPMVERRSPREQAEEEFARIEALDLVAAGERGHHVALMADVVRRYLAQAIPAAMPSLTTVELLGRLRGDGRVPFARLSRLLQDVDMVKFAGASIDDARASAAGAEARAVVTATDDAIEAERQRTASQAARSAPPGESTAREAA